MDMTHPQRHAALQSLRAELGRGPCLTMPA